MLHAEPMLPAEKAGKMPAARQATTLDWYQVSPPPPPHELLTTLGRLAALPPGANSQSAQESSEALEQELDSQPLQAIHFALGAMPTV